MVKQVSQLGNTATVKFSVDAQELASVIVTVYVVVEAGDTTLLGPLPKPFDQLNVKGETPKVLLALKVVEPPGQIEGLPTIWTSQLVHSDSTFTTPANTQDCPFTDCPFWLCLVSTVTVTVVAEPGTFGIVTSIKSKQHEFKDGSGP